MAKNETYRAFTARPDFILDMNGEILDKDVILSELANEIEDISAYSTYLARNDTTLGQRLAKANSFSPAVAGRDAGITIPSFMVSGKAGTSRKEKLIQYNTVTSFKSWEERVKAHNGSTTKRVSQGWKRTVNPSSPSYGEAHINLGTVDKQYAVIENNPFTDGSLTLKMVIQGKWYRLIFPFDSKRFPSGHKVTLPLVHLKNGVPVFTFNVVTVNPVVQFSERYIIGVDVGKVQYATLVVWDTKTDRVVAESTLSQRAHSLWNSIQASERQVKALWRIVENHPFDKKVKMRALDEIPFHRASASRKKEELAILAGQEIAAWSHEYSNAPVVFEDLGWLTNTMQNGRWNRGSLVQWATHYLSRNGGWALKVSAHNTSQMCHKCGTKGSFKGREFHCPSCGLVIDRDINAGANIAKRAIPKVTKAKVTRSKNKKLQKQPGLNTPIKRNSLRYPGRDRTKNGPTPKRKRNPKGVKLPLSPATVQNHTILETRVVADGVPHGNTGTEQAALNLGEITDQCKLCSPS